jgi:fermentation-respiration switch protein FrsA (DUF1100 family)
MNPPAEPARPDVERLAVKHAAGRTFGYFLRAGGVEPDERAGVVVYGHGNAAFAADWIFDAQPYTQAGLHFLCLEYRGYGASDGSPSEAGIVEDSAALLGQVLARADVDGANIVYHGRSLGGGVMAALAKVRPPARLILESTFSSVHSMSSRFMAPQYLVRDPLDVRSLLAASSGSFSGPVLLLHSRDDEVIPFREFEINRAAADPKRLEWVAQDGWGHNDSWFYPEGERLARFAVSGLSLDQGGE